MENNMDAYQSIDEIIKNFDFSSVQDVMVATDWWWAANNRVPTIAELEKTARHYLMEVAQIVSSGEHEHYSVYSGGLFAEAYKMNRNVCLRLAFQVTDSGSAFMLCG